MSFAWLKERIRPYYLRWLYFPLHPGRRPPGFLDCWKYPFERLKASSRLPPAGARPDLLFYPMTDWHTRIQRTQHLVRAFADAGFRCLFLNLHLGREFESTPLFDPGHRLSQIADNILELHVRLPREPVYHERLLTQAEEQIVAEAIGKVLPESARAVQILSFPLWMGVAQGFRESAGFPIVYDCHDLLSGFQNIGADLLQAEEKLLAESDLVLFSSQGLMDRYPRVRRKLMVRNAVPAGLFTGPERSEAGRVAGYVGALDSWFDIEAVEQAAAAHPECRFILAGRIEFEPIRRLAALPNVELTGEIPYDRVPELLAQFRVGLIPFRITPLTLMTNPIKLYEYFSAGLPVVATPLPEARTMGDLVYMAHSAAEFSCQVARAMEEEDASLAARRREIAQRESWTSRAWDIGEEFAKIQLR